MRRENAEEKTICDEKTFYSELPESSGFIFTA